MKGAGEREREQWVAAFASLRHYVGVTQEQLARMLQVSFATVNRWENGAYYPQRRHRRAVAAYAARHGFHGMPAETEKR